MFCLGLCRFFLFPPRVQRCNVRQTQNSPSTKPWGAPLGTVWQINWIWPIEKGEQMFFCLFCLFVVFCLICMILSALDRHTWKLHLHCMVETYNHIAVILVVACFVCYCSLNKICSNLEWRPRTLFIQNLCYNCFRGQCYRQINRQKKHPPPESHFKTERTQL